jgi:hypothetical protein
MWNPYSLYEARAKVLYLFDANVLIAASNMYYPMDQIPEFWDWIEHHARRGTIKLPLEIVEEVLAGTKNDDPLLPWVQMLRSILELDESADPAIVDKVVKDGYAPDLTDDEMDVIGQDPFLIAYALAGTERCVVTTEVSKPTKKRQNRKIPDVCGTFGVPAMNLFAFNRELGFKTSWKT